MNMRIIKAISGLSALILIAGVCFAAEFVSVDQKGLAFSARKLIVKKGSIVNFMNSDNTSHNILITGDGVKLNSGLQKPGVLFTAPFAKEGTYQVMCGIHPKMKMTVIAK